MIWNKEVLQRTKEKEMHLYNSIVKQKMAYAGHVLRGSSGDSALQILEGNIEGKLYQGRPGRMWLDDLKEWTQLETYTDIKRTVEYRSR